MMFPLCVGQDGSSEGKQAILQSLRNCDFGFSYSDPSVASNEVMDRMDRILTKMDPSKSLQIEEGKKGNIFWFQNTFQAKKYFFHSQAIAIRLGLKKVCIAAAFSPWGRSQLRQLTSC